MRAIDLLTDMAQRPLDALAALPELSNETANAHFGDHPNSITWLLWHTGRELDMQLADLSAEEQVWTSRGYRDRFGLGEIGDTMGYGHTPEQARAIEVGDAALLTGYVSAVLDAVDASAAATADSAWDEAVDEYEGGEVSRQARVTSILIDALEHLAQVAYVGGMTGR